MNLIFGCQKFAPTDRVCKVTNKKVFAEGSIAWLKCLWVIDVKLIHSRCEFIHWHVDKETSCLLLELFEAERVHDYFGCFLHFSFITNKNLISLFG